MNLKQGVREAKVICKKTGLRHSAYGALHKGPHQNQAIAQKLGILEYQEHTEDVLRTTYLSTY